MVDPDDRPDEGFGGRWHRASHKSGGRRRPVAIVDKFRAGNVIVRGVTVLCGNSLPFAIVAGLVFAIPLALLVFDEGTLADHLGRIVIMSFGNVVAHAITTLVLSTVLSLLTFMPVGPLGQDIVGLQITLVWTAAQVVLTTAVIYGVVSELTGKRVRPTGMLAGALSAVIPVFFVALMVGVVIGVLAMSQTLILGRQGSLGQTLRLFPALVILVFVWPAIPAAAIERLGLIASLKRGWVLSRGSRVNIFILLVVLLFIGFGLGLLAFLMGNVWVAAALLILFEAICASILAVGYVDLSRLRDGAGADQITQVFD